MEFKLSTIPGIFRGFPAPRSPLSENGKPPRSPRLNVLVLLFLLCTCVNAQYNTTFLNYSRYGRSIGVGLEYEAGSNGMSGELANRLLWGGHISPETKAESRRLLKGRNNFGVMLNYDLSAFFKGGKKFDFLVGVKNQEVLNATYSRDFFNLMFEGNGYFRGSAADLSNCSVNALRFQELKAGVIIHHIDTLGTIGVSISFLKGEQLFFIRTNQNSSLYTSSLGDELVFNSNFSMAISDSTNKGPTVFNGVGASADLYFETPYKSRLGKRSVLVVNASNVGFIHWWKNSAQYSSDSSLHFSGLTIRNISDLRDSTIASINRDTLLRNLANARNEDFNVNIPANLLLFNKWYFGARERFVFSAGFRYVFNANYKGYIFMEPEYRVGDCSFVLHTGYGGYARFNVGASASYIGPRWFVRLGSNALQGLVFRKKVFAQGVFFCLGWRMR